MNMHFYVKLKKFYVSVIYVFLILTGKFKWTQNDILTSFIRAYLFILDRNWTQEKGTFSLYELYCSTLEYNNNVIQKMLERRQENVNVTLASISQHYWMTRFAPD